MVYPDDHVLHARPKDEHPRVWWARVSETNDCTYEEFRTVLSAPEFSKYTRKYSKNCTSLYKAWRTTSRHQVAGIKPDTAKLAGEDEILHALKLAQYAQWYSTSFPVPMYEWLPPAIGAVVNVERKSWLLCFSILAAFSDFQTMSEDVTNKKRKREVALEARITYHTPAKSFERLFNGEYERCPGFTVF